MPGAVATSSVLEFYNDATIFITGGTGFVGKGLIEKLLRVCPSIVHIYLLVRVKKGKDPQKRFKELFEDPIFKKLRSEQPDFEKKITCIPGDISAVRLNMSDSDYEFLTKEVTHVFHSAATVRFNEHIKSAIGINVLGTREIVTFCNKCTRLKVFVHVSTAYSHCVTTKINEEFYDPPMSAERAINLMETLSEDRLEALTPELIKPWPNTYTFTKAIAESIVKENARSIPSLIVRPSIVMGSMREPVAGWTDNFYGPTGVIIGVGIGLIRVILVDKHCEANLVPVDLTVNAILSSAWEIGSSFNNNTITENSLTESNGSVGLSKKTETIPKIYNFVGDRNNILTWASFLDKTYEIGANLPSVRSIWCISVTLTQVRFIYLWLAFILHFIPGFLMDAVLLLLGKKPQMVKAYRKVHVFGEATSFFSRKSWHFNDHNMKKLWSRLSDREKEMFFFDTTSINWDDYLRGVIMGIRSFILKEPEHLLPSARRKVFFFWLAHRLLQLSLIGFCFWILSKYLFVSTIFKAQFKEPILMQTGNST